MNAPQPIILECGALRVVWRRRGDRFTHEMGVVHQGSFLSLLESLEGGPDEPWPASPVLQDIHVEPRDQRTVVLAVGQAGHSHWSLSVETDAASGEILFDAACRVRTEPGWLGSGYTCRSMPISELQPTVARFETPAGSCELHADSNLRQDVIGGAQGAPTLRMDAPRQAPSLPATFRWRYRLGLRT